MDLKIPLILSLVTLFPIGLAYAQAGNLCYEDGTYCDFSNKPLEAILQPIITPLGVWTYVIIWGGMLGALWVGTKSAGIVTIVGVFYSGVLASELISADTLAVGYGLAGITIGIYAFIIFMKAQYT